MTAGTIRHDACTSGAYELPHDAAGRCAGDRECRRTGLPRSLARRTLHLRGGADHILAHVHGKPDIAIEAEQLHYRRHLPAAVSPRPGRQPGGHTRHGRPLPTLRSSQPGERICAQNGQSSTGPTFNRLRDEFVIHGRPETVTDVRKTLHRAPRPTPIVRSAVDAETAVVSGGGVARLDLVDPLLDADGAGLLRLDGIALRQHVLDQIDSLPFRQRCLDALAGDVA